MNVPKLRFKGFSDEWITRDLENCLTQNRLGGNYDNSEANVGLPVIKMGNVARGKIVLDKVQYLPLNSPYDKDDVLKEGDILFNTRNTLDLVGKVAIWRNELPIALYNSNLMRLSFNNNFERTNKFVNALFNTQVTIKKLRSYATGTTSVAAIYTKDLLNLSISYPSLEEQKKVARFFSVIDKKLGSLKKKKELLGQYKKGLMQKIFSQELRFKDENGKEFPEWEYLPGDEIFLNISNKKHNSDLPILAITQEFGAIPRDLIDFNITVTDKSIDSYKVVEMGDFIISLRSFQGGIEYSEHKGICSPAYIILRPAISVDRRFYKFYLKTESYIQQLQKNLEGIRDGKMISYKYFSEIFLPLPSVAEQEKIADFLSSIDKKIELVSKQVEKSELWKKGLLQKMFV